MDSPEKVTKEQDEIKDPLNEIDTFIQGESWGGNAGPNMSGASAAYDETTESFVFSNNPKDWQNRPVARFRVLASIPWSEAFKLMDRNQPIPPNLIIEVESSDPDKMARFMGYAGQHNTIKIKQYLSIGGDPKLLPKTAILPKRDPGKSPGS